MKKNVLAFAVLFCMCNVFAVQTKNSGFSIEPFAGLRNGKVGEYVYARNSKDSSRYHLSYLEWETKPLFFAGLRGNKSWNGAEANLYFKVYFPGKCGTLEDSDWLQDYGYNTGNSSIKTNYSFHDNKLKKGYGTGGSFSTVIFRNEFLNILPTLAFDFESLSFEGYDGTAFYGNPNGGNSLSYYPFHSDNSTKINFDGKVITYTRYDLYAWAGLGIKAFPINRTVIGVYGFVSPYAFAYGIDDHILTGKKMKNFTDGYFSAYKLNLFYLHKCSEKIYVKFDCTFLTTKEMKGNRYVKNSSSDSYKKSIYEDSDGSDSRYTEYSVSAVIKL